MLQKFTNFIKKHDIDAYAMWIGGSAAAGTGVTYTIFTGDLTGLLGLIGLPVGAKGADLIQNYYYSEPLGHRVRVIGGNLAEKIKYIESCKVNRC